MLALKAHIVELAQELGFDQVRIASAEPLTRHKEIAKDRIDLGYMDGIPWFTRERMEKASRPQNLLPGARSIIAVALSYLPNENDVKPKDNMIGKVARYAQWTDYHQVMKNKLHILASKLPEITETPVLSRVFVDDSPLLERAVAERSGLGWFGKNTNILTSTHGSWVFLGSLITNLELEPDEPVKKNCGDCVRCIPACPTQAIVAPYVIDATRCISYLTIECRGSIPKHLRPLVGDWVFGCDICQEVCPVNHDVVTASMVDLKRTGFSVLELLPLLKMTQSEFSALFRNTPMKRAKLEGMQRNACVALGNIGNEQAVLPLAKAMKEGMPLIRGHAAWALGRIGNKEALHELKEALEYEHDSYVRDEIEDAILDAGNCHVETNGTI